MAKVRVLRLLEYIYDDIQTFADDSSRWAVQGQYSPNTRMLIKSVVLPLEVMEDLGERPND